MPTMHPWFCVVIVGAATAVWQTPARALPLPTTAQAIAGDGVVDYVASRAQRHYRGRAVQRRPASRHHRAYSRRQGNAAGAAFAGAALGILGGALAASAAPTYGDYDEPVYEAYPAYAPAYGYYSGPAYPAYGYGGGYGRDYDHGGGYGYGGGYYGRHGGGSYTDQLMLSGQPGSLNQP